MVGSNDFQKWLKDGADYATGLSTSVMLDADHTNDGRLSHDRQRKQPAGQNVAVQLNGVNSDFRERHWAPGTTTITADQSGSGWCSCRMAIN